MKHHYIFTYLIMAAVLLASPVPASGQRAVTISDAIDSSLAFNPQLLMTDAKLDASEATVRQATGSLLPQLYATAGYTRYEEPNIVTPIHEQGVFPPLDDEIYEANLQLSIPIFDGGRRLTKRKAATADVDESRATDDLVRNEILQQVAEIFLYARRAEDQSVLINKRLASLYRQLHDLQSLEKEGRVSKGDLALVSSLIASMKSDSSVIARSRHQLGIRLSALMGTDDEMTPAISENGMDLEALIQSYPLTDFEANGQSGPGVRVSEARFKKAQAYQSLATRELWPEISGYGVYSYRTGSDWDPVSEWTIGIKFSLPLFTGGSRISNIEEAASLRRASENALRSAKLEQQSILQTAYNDYISAANRRDYLSTAVKEKSIAVQTHFDLYEAGRIPLRDLHVQETELLQLQIEKYAQQYEARLALLRYEAATGTLTRSKVISLAGGVQ